MYKTLEKVLKDLKITKSYLSEKVLNYEYPKYLSIRINGSTEFKPHEKAKIYKFCKEKGYEGTEEELLQFTPYKKTKKEVLENHQSKIIRKRMKELHLTNKQLAEQIDVSENAISLWKNGKVKNLKTNFMIPLSKALKIPTLYLMGDEMFKDDERRSDLEEENIKNEYDIYNKIFDLIIRYMKEWFGGISKEDYKDLDMLMETNFKGLLREKIATYLFSDIAPLIMEMMRFNKNIDSIDDSYFNRSYKDLTEDENYYMWFKRILYDEYKERNSNGKE